MQPAKKRAVFIIAIGLMILTVIGCIIVWGGHGNTPSSAKLLSLGEKYLSELDYERALAQFLKVIEIEPMNPHGYLGAAESYSGLRQNENAILLLERGLAALPDNSEIQARLDELKLIGESEPEIISEPPDKSTSELADESSSEAEEAIGMLDYDVNYYLSNPGYSGSIVFFSDNTFVMQMEPHNAGGSGVSGAFSVESPTEYTLNAGVSFSYEDRQSYNENYTAIIVGDRLIVNRESDGYEYIFYIPDGDIVQPDIIEEDEAIADTKEVINLRKGPGTEYDVILEIPAFYPLHIKGYSESSAEWVFIQYYELTGWVSSQYLEGVQLTNSAAQTQGAYSIDSNYSAMVGRSFSDIKEILGDYQSEFMFHAEYYVNTPNSDVHYFFQGDDGTLSGTFEWTMNETDVCTKVASTLENIVSGFTNPTTIAEFTENLASATRYEMLVSGGTSYYVAAETYAVVYLSDGRNLEINMDDAGDTVSPNSYAWLR